MVSLASLFTLQLRAADRQVLLLEPAAGSTAAKPALAPGHRRGWTHGGPAAASPAQGQPHSAHWYHNLAFRTRSFYTRKCAAIALQTASLGPILPSLGEIMVLTM